jgi:hypothetical protein
LKIAIFRDVGTQFSKKTHRLIMIEIRNSTPSYDRKPYLSHCLKRRVFVIVKPSYGLRLRQVMPEVTKTELAAWQQERNQEHAKVKWQFTTADARIKLHHLYPQF